MELASAEMTEESRIVPKKCFILSPQYELYWDSKLMSYMYNGQKVREEMILKRPQMLRIASNFHDKIFLVCISFVTVSSSIVITNKALSYSTFA